MTSIIAWTNLVDLTKEERKTEKPCGFLVPELINWLVVFGGDLFLKLFVLDRIEKLPILKSFCFVNHADTLNLRNTE
jgi:hypothetical protein